MSQIQLIGLAGGAGVGKDTLANLYFRPQGFLSAALADEIKVRVVASGRATFEEVFITKPPHVRKLLQEEGTERGRDIYGENYWVDILFAQLQKTRFRWGFERFVVTDVRFPNESDRIREAGGQVYLINAPTRYANNGMSDEARQHRSERALDGYTNYDGIINNDPEWQSVVGTQIYNLLRDHDFAQASGHPGFAGFKVGI